MYLRFLIQLTFLGYLLAVCATSAEVAAQSVPGYHDHPSLPAGDRGERTEALLDALNENSADAVEEFMASHVSDEFRETVPMDVHTSVFTSIYRQTGGVDFHSVRTYDPPRSETVVIVRDRLYEGWHSFVLGFSNSDDRIAGIQFTPARPPADAEDSVLASDDLVPSVRDAVSKGCAQGAFSGAVLVARGGDVLFEMACGEASKRFRVPNNVETKFNLGSMNKMFTSVAVMQLVESGRLDLDDPISEHVDESWLPREITDRVTVHHLLTHTSGLGSYFNQTFMESSRARYREIDDYKPLVRGDTLAFAPGERFRYSNTGMLLLGVVIESLTGTSYFDYVRDHIYRPAGMEQTDSYSMDEPVPNLAIGYIPEPTSPYGWRNNIFEHVMKGGPAGGGFSTVHDLHRFAQALVSEELVSRDGLNGLWTSHSEAGYGYGFGISEGPSGKVVGHSGGFPGLNGNLDIFLDSGYVVAVLSNHDGAASPLADHIKRLIGRVEGI